MNESASPPHLKTWTQQEKEAARKAFDEGSRQRAEAMRNQRPLTQDEMMERLKKP